MNPAQDSTGSRGYFANRGSRSESWHSRNTDPRADRISLLCRHSSHSPAPGGGGGGGR
jgi:hypothetical protein